MSGEGKTAWVFQHKLTQDKLLHIHISYLSVAAIRHHDQKQHKEERVDFGLWFQRARVPNARENMRACSRSRELAGHTFSPSMGSREVSQKVSNSQSLPPVSYFFQKI